MTSLISTDSQSVQCQTDMLLPPGADDVILLSRLFSQLMLDKDIPLPDDYLLYSCKAMLQLSQNGRSNVLYKLAKGIGTDRADGTDSCFPCKRMPIGLLEYMVDFFSCHSIQEVCHY